MHDNGCDCDVESIQSGKWSDPLTWLDNRLPYEGSGVHITEGTIIDVDIECSYRLNEIHIEGTLNFLTDRNTQVIFETMHGDGSLIVGTVANPIGENFTAKLIIKSNGEPINHDTDPTELSRGIRMESPVSIVGYDKEEISPIIGFPEKGTRQLTIEKELFNWRVGDELLLAPTLWGQDEIFKIVEINHQVVTLDNAIVYTRTNVPKDANVKIHVGNMTRNVIIMTDESQAGDSKLQGHIMLMGGGHTVMYARIQDMGRTLNRAVNDVLVLPDGTRDPSLMPLCNLSEENIRGRYALHFHNPGPASTPSFAEGNVIQVQRNAGFKIGIQNHSAHVYADRNIVHQIDGSGLFAEEGNERGSFNYNFVVHSKGNNAEKAPLPGNEPCQKNNYPEIWNRRRLDMGSRGAGLWLQGSGNVTVIGNIFCGHAHAAIDHKAGGLDKGKNNTFAVLVRPDHLRDGYAWVTAKLGNIDPSIAILQSTMPPLLIKDNIAYAIGNDDRYGEKAFFHSDNMGLQMIQWPERPKNLLIGNFAWNIGRAVSCTYSDWGQLENCVFIGGYQYPNSRQSKLPEAHGGVSTLGQGGQYWVYRNVKINEFGVGYEFKPSPNSVIENVTINGVPYEVK